jgi:hypothetical protein
MKRNPIGGHRFTRSAGTLFNHVRLAQAAEGMEAENVGGSNRKPTSVPFSVLQTRIDWFTFQSQNSEDALVNAGEGFMADETFEGFDPEGEFTQGKGAFGSETPCAEAFKVFRRGVFRALGAIRPHEAARHAPAGRPLAMIRFASGERYASISPTASPIARPSRESNARLTLSVWSWVL